MLDAAAVHAAVPPERAIERTRLAFERQARGEWAMPPKVYVDSPPHGDFRAMPARGDGFASLKWVTSFPHNPERGLPVVAGALLLSDADTGALLAIVDCAAVTSLRTGAAAAVSARALARDSATTVGLIGCGVNGGWAARCLAADGYRDGVCADARRMRPSRSRASSAGAPGTAPTPPPRTSSSPSLQASARSSSTPTCVRASTSPCSARMRTGKAEVEPAALERCRLFCDEWEQAAGGGELAGPVAAGVVDRGRVTEIGDVLIGAAPGRRSNDELTLFDSTGLATQDLGIAIAVYEAWRTGAVVAATAPL